MPTDAKPDTKLDLKPCPFNCGHTPDPDLDSTWLYYAYNKSCVQCVQCGAEGPTVEAKLTGRGVASFEQRNRAAAAAWNRRAEVSDD